MHRPFFIRAVLFGVRRKGNKIMQRTLKKYFPIFMLPTLIAFMGGFVIPFVLGLYLSFCKFTTVTDGVFVGLSNYKQVFTDPTFIHAFGFTVLYAIAVVLLVNLLAFFVAMLLTKGFRGTNVFRTVFFMPNLIGGIVLGWVWQLILNGILGMFGKTLTYDAKYGFWGMVILTLWQSIGYMMIIYIAGFQNVPEDVIESAQIDGATPLQILTKIKIPLMMPSITICTFLTLTNAFKMFDQNLALTNGAPSKMTQLLALNIYSTFYDRPGSEGIGQAKAVIFCIIVCVVALIQLRATRSKEVQQ